MLLLVGFVSYTVYLLNTAKEEPTAIQVEYEEFLSQRIRPLVAPAALTILGFITLFVGANWVVSGAATSARFFGISELAVGLTLTAWASTLPELFIAVAASRRGEGERVSC